MEVEIYAGTDVGCVRSLNEDNYLVLNLSNSEFWTKSKESDESVIQSQSFAVDENGVVLAASDGCGGAAAGEVASEMAVEAIRGMFSGEVTSLEQSFEEGILIEKLYDATLYANRLIHNCQLEDPEYGGMGCTLTAVGITSNSIDFLQVGDSRAFLIRKSKIYQITKDQSLVNQLVDAGQITPEEAETHALKNVILEALGAQNKVNPDVVRLISQRNDILLLCSDGLSNNLTDFDLLRVVIDNRYNLENACKVLIQEANERGGEDNITVILAKLSGSELMEAIEGKVIIYPLKFDIRPN